MQQQNVFDGSNSVLLYISSDCSWTHLCCFKSKSKLIAMISTDVAIAMVTSPHWTDGFGPCNIAHVGLHFMKQLPFAEIKSLSTLVNSLHFISVIAQYSLALHICTFYIIAEVFINWLNRINWNVVWQVLVGSSAPPEKIGELARAPKVFMLV